MSASEVSVTLTCDNAAAELLVVDSDFKLVVHGPPPLQARIEPGIYSLKAKIGADVSERLEVLTERADPYHFNLIAPEFESPIPLVGTRTHRKYQQNSVEQFTGATASAHVLGRGSALMLYVRDTSRRNFDLPQEHAEHYADNFRGLSLLTAGAGPLLDFGSQCVARAELGYCGMQVQLDPGAYVLAWTRDNEQTCLAVNAVPGWMLQVYLRLQPTAEGSIKMRPDFCEAAFAYDRLGTPYCAYRDDFRPMEALRLALLDRRNVVSGQLLRELLDGKYENPMMGVYAGHLMLTDAKCDPVIFGKVIANTAALLGPSYPDLLPLAWGFERATGKRPAGYDTRPWAELLAEVQGPPLLTPSWDLLLNCAEASGAAIESLPAFSIAGNLAVSGTVLTWRRCTRLRPSSPSELQTSVATGASESKATRSPGPTPVVPAAAAEAIGVIGVGTLARSVFGKLGASLWNTWIKPLITRLPDGSIAEAPKLEVKQLTIDTPAAAARAMRQIANKAPWHDLVRYVISNQHAHGEELASVSALQRDLMLTLARASSDPAVLEAIDEEYMSGVMRTHRVPLSTVASALSGLDFLAVSTEIIRRVKANLKRQKERVS